MLSVSVVAAMHVAFIADRLDRARPGRTA